MSVRIATALTTMILLLSAGPSFAGAFDSISVPEPATMTLFGLGIGGAFLARKFLGRR
jgi:PEP-CTERM motif-containing protein